jgi:hypothetical protein
MGICDSQLADDSEWLGVFQRTNVCPVSCDLCTVGMVCNDFGIGRIDIGAVAMPYALGFHNDDPFTHITAMTGWGNHFELCCDNDVVTGVSTTATDYLHHGSQRQAGAGELHAAAEGEMVQLTCTDFVDHCSVAPIIDCGLHGQCGARSCTCADGYSGKRCEDADHCIALPIIDCGLHGVCNAGSCYCANGYSGERCTVGGGGGDGR